jgi:hypothetical protein
MIIEDSTGSSSGAKVTKDNALRVTTASAICEASLRGDAYSWNSVSYNMTAADTVLLIANESPTRLLVINRIYVWSDVPTSIDVHFPAKATWTGTAVTGVNLNRASSKVAAATAITDETGQATQGPIYITLQTNEATGAQFAIDFYTDDVPILGKDDAIGVDMAGNAAAYECTIIGYFIDIPE